MPTTLSASATHETFAGCASFYDALTAHHDYELLTDVLEEILAQQGHPGTRMLDLACGTGKSFLPFMRRGYDVVASDVSAEMLDRARTKAGAGAELHVADMRDLPRLGSFDLVTCIDEPINYLLEPGDVASCFESVERNLRPGGLFVFDLNTLHAYRSVFARDEVYEQEGWLFAWRGHGDFGIEQGACLEFTIEAFAEEGAGTWRRLTNPHAQRHHPSDEVRELLGAAGLECRAVYGLTPDGSFDRLPDEGSHTKLIYVARRATRDQGR
jgi:SAM-dependent methyltransferase